MESGKKLGVFAGRAFICIDIFLYFCSSVLSCLPLPRATKILIFCTEALELLLLKRSSFVREMRDTLKYC